MTLLAYEKQQFLHCTCCVRMQVSKPGRSSCAGPRPPRLYAGQQSRASHALGPRVLNCSRTNREQPHRPCLGRTQAAQAQRQGSAPRAQGPPRSRSRARPSARRFRPPPAPAPSGTWPCAARPAAPGRPPCLRPAQCPANTPHAVSATHGLWHNTRRQQNNQVQCEVHKHGGGGVVWTNMVQGERTMHALSQPSSTVQRRAACLCSLLRGGRDALGGLRRQLRQLGGKLLHLHHQQLRSPHIHDLLCTPHTAIRNIHHGPQHNTHSFSIMRALPHSNKSMLS